MPRRRLEAAQRRRRGEPAHAGAVAERSLWYRWTAPRSGRFQVAATSSDFDPILAVYTGSTLRTLSLVDPGLNSAANDKSNGALLWEAQLPAAGNTTPSTYMVEGKQYIVIACGGGKNGAPSGGTYVAFALP